MALSYFSILLLDSYCPLLIQEFSLSSLEHAVVVKLFIFTFTNPLWWYFTFNFIFFDYSPITLFSE